MATISEALTIAVQHHQAGQLQAAEQIYRQILEVDPNQVDALHLLGVIASQVGKHEFAVVVIGRAIELNGSEPAYHGNLGNAFKAMGKLDEAIGSYRRALELKADDAGANYNLGSALQEQGKLEEAIACFHRAMDLQPDFAEAHNNLGTAFQAQRKLDEALKAYGRALELRPDHAEASNNRGAVFQAQGKLDDAVASFRRAVELKPDYAEAHNNLGNTLKDQGKLEEAVASCRQALELKPDYAEAHCNLGNALKDQGKLDEAIACYGRALELKPDLVGAHSNLGTAFQALGRLDEAIACYRRAMRLNPDFDAAYHNFLFAIQYSPAFDAAAICEENLQFGRERAEPLSRFIARHANEGSPNRRLRVGYVSPDFREHCLALFMLPTFASHDHRNYEIFCYSDVARPDQMTNRLRTCADVWRNIAGLSDERVAQLIRQDRIDILVDLTMHMAGSRLLVFARNPAPVQVCWLAYPGTTGLKAIDYRLTDPILDPPGLHDESYSEQSIRLPDCFWCYDPQTDGKAVNGLPALGNGFVTFGCLNSFCKVNAAVLELWAGVLRNVERSQLLLLAPEGSAREQVLSTMRAAGISADRITFVARQFRDNYLKLYNQIDMGLDTFPYNGHTTSLDSFWMGVPVVTLVGQTVVGRAGLCQLQNLGLPELVAHTPEQFIEISCRLANDLSRLGQLRATLRERIEKSPLMDAPRFTRNIEAAYRDMWQRWCAAGERSSSA